MSKNIKSLASVHKSPPVHWVGDGLPVSTALSHHQFGEAVSPFLLLDYAEPYLVEPSLTPRGVDEHPHRGFETVTVVYQGELEHRDSGGNHGRIGPGEVQWMTAGSGLVHEEKYSEAFTQKGGWLEMVQLWVNLPAKDKMSSPGYQTLTKSQIPEISLDDGAGVVRVIAGQFEQTQGPAKTFTPVNLWDLRLNAGGSTTLRVPAGSMMALFVLKGEAWVNETAHVLTKDLALFESEGEEVSLSAVKESVVLVLSGQPIQEPVTAYGPFVMNTQQEIVQALSDYRSGKMGHI